MVKGWVVCPCMSKTLGSPSSGVTPLEVLLYGDVNMRASSFIFVSSVQILVTEV